MRGSEFIHDIPIDEKFGISLKLFRLDELHPVIQGNKYFKLLHNLEKARSENLQIVTMGGAAQQPHTCNSPCLQKWTDCMLWDYSWWKL